MSPIEFVDRAEEAWEQGFRVVASRLNQLLAIHAPPAVIPTKPPKDGWTLKRACDQLLNAFDGLRHHGAELPRRGDEICPWTYCDGCNLCCDGLAQQALDRFISPDSTPNWIPATWKTMVVDPVVHDAKQWRAWFTRLRRWAKANGRQVHYSRLPNSAFVPTPLQAAILKALNGSALKKQPLALEVCGGEGTRLYKPGGINELRAEGLVDHRNGVGYFRPDAPPPYSVQRRKPSNRGRRN